MVLLQFAAGSFHIKTLCSRLFSIEPEFYSQNEKFAFDPPFGGLGVGHNVRTSSIARWKAHVGLPIRDN